MSDREAKYLASEKESNKIKNLLYVSCCVIGNNRIKGTKREIATTRFSLILISTDTSSPRQAAVK